MILSGAEALRDQGDRGPPDPEIVEEIGAAGSRARDLTRQLLAFARKQVVAPVPVDLNDVVRASCRIFARLLGEDVELHMYLQPDLWAIRCDRGQLEQVVMNLAVNARDAMTKGGSLTISTRNVDTLPDVIPDDVAGPPTSRAGGFVVLIVRDSGPGMTAEVKSHLFEPFFTTKPKGEGTGLGLATLYGIVEQSGGHVHVTSELGEGTAFHVYFPRTRDAAADPPPPAPIVARGTEAVLVVEDDPQVRGVTVRAMQSGGYRVVAAASGRDALRLVAAELARVRLLVTDVVMPGIDGPSLAAELCRRYPGLRVLYVSGYVDDALGKRGALAPGAELLAKPFTAASLLARVRAVLDAT